jgi:hypothetical protein
MEYRREIALVFSIDEALDKLNIIRGHGFSEFEIHVFSKDIQPLQSLKMYTDIHIHEAGNLLDQFFSLLLNQNRYEVSLRNMKLSSEELAHYGHGIEQGGIFIIAQHDYPMDKEPKKAGVAWNVSKVTD